MTKKMLTKIFCEIDDFMQEFEGKYKEKWISLLRGLFSTA